MNQILLTGGTGYIGSHVAVALLEQGHDIILYDNLSNSKADTLTTIASLTNKTPYFEQACILDESRLDKIFADHDISAVIHFAGLKAVGESVEKPDLYHRVNVEGSQSLLRAMHKASVSTLLYSSTAAVYGESATQPIQETATLSPANPYGVTKLEVERLMQTHASQHEVHFCALRYFNPVGAHPSGLLGENPNNRPNNLVPLLMSAASGGMPLTIFGSDYPTEDGTCIRDYIAISDLVSGHLSALSFLESVTGYHCFNLGTGRGVSVAEMLSAFTGATGVSVPHVYGSRRAGDVATLLADPSLANEVLQWEAQATLPSMLQSAWKWHLHSTATATSGE